MEHEVDKRAWKGKIMVEYYINKNTVLCLLVFYCNFVMRWVQVWYFISDFFLPLYTILFKICKYKEDLHSHWSDFWKIMKGKKFGLFTRHEVGVDVEVVGCPMSLCISWCNYLTKIKIREIWDRYRGKAILTVFLWHLSGSQPVAPVS
jgi:hypothetical protein